MGATDISVWYMMKGSENDSSSMLYMRFVFWVMKVFLLLN